MSIITKQAITDILTCNCRQVKFRQKIKYAGMVKLANTPDLGSGVERLAGSSPVTRTTKQQVFEACCFNFR